MRKFTVLAACCLVLLAGCAGIPTNIAPGTPREAVLSRMGKPTRVVPMPTGERLQYSLQPSGRMAWMIDLDASGKVVRSTQALTEASFRRVDTGRWTRDDIEREFGPPAWVDRVGNWPGPIMTYRWNDDINDMFWWFYLDNRNVVGRSHAGIDFPHPQQPDNP
jgi:hypothetical protein